MRLKDKLILVTGASAGIGFAVAKKCVEEGARVILVARTKQNLKEALSKLGKNNHAFFPADVGNLKQVIKLSNWVKKKFGNLDGLVNCAGIIGSIGPFHQTEIKEFIQTIQTNLLGTVFMCYYFAPLLKNRGAKIVNFSGGGATSPFTNFSAYASSKAAVVRFTENIAEEFKELNISVNSVAPGFVITKIHENIFKAGKKAGEPYLNFAKDQIKKGGVSPEKGAALTAFLLSRESDGINGKLISAPWDPWEDCSFKEILRSQKNMATLRRIDAMNFSELVKR